MVDPALLSPLVPRGTELDPWEGKALVSMVGFLFLQTRVFGLPIPFHRDFEEVNLRFYVRRRGPEGWRRGVVFVKEIVPRRVIAWTARVLYNEKYVALPMRHIIAYRKIEPPQPWPGWVEYAWRHAGRWNRLGLESTGEPTAPAPGSEEKFVTEHYRGYVSRRDGSTTEYRVEHPLWRVWRAKRSFLDCDTGSLYGQGFAPWLLAVPTSAFLAEGSPVTVSRGRRIA